jgi:CO/xanthine dehydrogenase FAD-binding subunit
MTIWKNYHLAHSVTDALQALALAPDSASLIAGGTDLLLDLQQGRHPPVDTLVDVTAIDEMKVLEIREDQLFVGASVPLNQIVRSSLIQEHAQALIEACGLIGGPQVRNTATLGGNVGHALPAADGTIALMAMGAQAEIADLDGRRIQPLDSLFLGPGKSSLQPGRELLVGFYLPLHQPGSASAFRRVMRPQGVALPILNMAAWVYRQNNLFVDLHIAVGPSGPVPKRIHAAEDVLRGKTLTEASFAEALQALLGSVRYRTSPRRASAEYRRHISESLLQETLWAAWQRAA